MFIRLPRRVGAAWLAWMAAAPSLADEPRRLVSLEPSTTEILFAIGAGERLVGRSDFCNFPEEAAALPSVGSLTDPNLEKVVELAPDLVIAQTTHGRRHLDRLRQLGLRVEVYDGEPSLSALFDSILAIGRWSGRSAPAKALASALRQRMEATPVTGPRPTLLWIIWWDPLMTFGRRSYQHELMERAGGRNAGEDSPQKSFTMSLEAVVSAAPDLLVVPCSDAADCRDAGRRFHERFAGQPGWRALPAVRHRAYCLMPQDVGHRPGPRVAEALDRLRACVAASPGTPPVP